jgi:hypothetical protein
VDEGGCRLDLPITVVRKPRRFWSVRPLVMLPHAPGLSHALPADNYYIGVRLDWVIHTNKGIGVQPGLEVLRNVAPLL